MKIEIKNFLSNCAVDRPQVPTPLLALIIRISSKPLALLPGILHAEPRPMLWIRKLFRKWFFQRTPLIGSIWKIAQLRQLIVKRDVLHKVHIRFYVQLSFKLESLLCFFFMISFSLFSTIHNCVTFWQFSSIPRIINYVLNSIKGNSKVG